MESLNKESGSLMLRLERSFQIKELVVPGLSLEAFLIVPVDIYKNSHIHKYIYTCAQIHKYIYTCTQIHKYTYMYTHIDIYIKYVYTSYMNVCKSLQICIFLTNPCQFLRFLMDLCKIVRIKNKIKKTKLNYNNKNK